VKRNVQRLCLSCVWNKWSSVVFVYIKNMAVQQHLAVGFVGWRAGGWSGLYNRLVRAGCGGGCRHHGRQGVEMRAGQVLGRIKE
jgi:hypothetical protein